MKIPHWQFLFLPTVAFGIGFILNAAVMAANHGQMPVLVPSGDARLLNPHDLVHCAMAAQTHLKFLADWVVINGVGIASPGDFLEWFYEATFVPALAIWITLVIKDKNAGY